MEWKDTVFEPVQYVGQRTVSSRWVKKQKRKIKKNEVNKARLVAAGFEYKNFEILKYSPTCTEEPMRLMLTLFAFNGWTCNIIDIKSTFLYGKQIDRTVYLVFSNEFEEKNMI